MEVEGEHPGWEIVSLQQLCVLQEVTVRVCARLRFALCHHIHRTEVMPYCSHQVVPHLLQRRGKDCAAEEDKGLKRLRKMKPVLHAVATSGDKGKRQGGENFEQVATPEWYTFSVEYV